MTQSASASKPGDAIRQGRRLPPSGDGQIAFVEGGGCVQARLGVVTVGAISINPTGGKHAYAWSCFLPMTPRMQPAGDLDKAKSALLFKIHEWCAAAGVVISAAALKRLQEDRA